MSYALRIGPEAEEQLARQPEPLRSYIEDALRRFAESPTSLRRFVAKNRRGPALELRFDSAGSILWITVEYRFGADEQTMHVERIHVEFGA